MDDMFSSMQKVQQFQSLLQGMTGANNNSWQGPSARGGWHSGGAGGGPRHDEARRFQKDRSGPTLTETCHEFFKEQKEINMKLMEHIATNNNTGQQQQQMQMQQQQPMQWTTPGWAGTVQNGYTSTTTPSATTVPPPPPPSMPMHVAQNGQALIPPSLQAVFDELGRGQLKMQEAQEDNAARMASLVTTCEQQAKILDTNARSTAVATRTITDNLDHMRNNTRELFERMGPMQERLKRLESSSTSMDAIHKWKEGVTKSLRSVEVDHTSLSQDFNSVSDRVMHTEKKLTTITSQMESMAADIAAIKARQAKPDWHVGLLDAKVAQLSKDLTTLAEHSKAGLTRHIEIEPGHTDFNGQLGEAATLESAADEPSPEQATIDVNTPETARESMGPPTGAGRKRPASAPSKAAKGDTPGTSVTHATMPPGLPQRASARKKKVVPPAEEDE